LRILLLGSDTPLGQTLQDHLLRIGRHQIEGLSRSACRWKSERQAKKSVRRANCELVVDLRINAALDGGEDVSELDSDSCHWVAKACHRDGNIYLYASSYRLFSGNIDRLYAEEDNPDCVEASARWLTGAEQAVREGCEKHLILRLGPVFSHLPGNWLPSLLLQLQTDGRVVLGDQLCGNPIAAKDAVRVIGGLVDQLSAGAQTWGTFNYCSAGSTTPYEVAETLVAAASQFSQLDAGQVALENFPASGSAINRTLDCRKIRNTFAIKQMPWREFIAATVKQYFQQN
jgi:dTDP-4-dehydrorhamnose reductase